jgi:prefoldin subunit 5
MADSGVQRSQRFTKAARAERDRLARRRSQIFKKREDLQGKIDLLDEELEAVDQEISNLESLAFSPTETQTIRLADATEEGDPSLLSGSIIRIIAVPFLLRAQGTAPIHYRDWFGLLTAKGYAVAGKRPDAVFLNQVVRSPLVRATTKSGFYEIDLDAVDRLQDRLRVQQSKLGELLRQAPAKAGEAFDRYREQQRELNTEIARTERELTEATSAIEAWRESEAPAVEAA